ncbi:hypothetical protein IEQ11_14450 [Lysobacter capsici]|uniref:hypothetical protein n=1 Tax=Lysobacter capsici TaxID=435897 RepID=UPI00177DB33B|nr:hypothetical protein [Lysobacter capsici]UOF12960.1 hypothetical protein IEQ11_14450 [Lysobacter capsici]
MSEFDPNRIEVLSASEAVRRRPGMYMDPELPGLASVLAMQSLCHAVDEAMDGRCTSIRMQVDGERVSVHYDCGMPLHVDHEYPGRTVAETFLRILGACSSRKKHIEIGSQFCQIGLGVLNPMCAEMEVEIVDEGHWTRLRFERGVQQWPCVVQPADRPDGTWMEFSLDTSVIADPVLREETLRAAFADLQLHLPRLALSLEFNGLTP